MTPLPCMVCDAPMSPYFVKDFGGQYGLGDVRYTHCANCRFVQSDTHFRMTDAEWAHVNETGHTYQGTDENLSDPRWLERLEAQRNVFVYLDSVRALPREKPWVDWGAGDGKLSKMLTDAGVPMDAYDAYAGHAEFLQDADLSPHGFDLVLSTSVLEHLRDRATLDAMEALVSPRGVFAIHTLVRDEAPRDPGWFYYMTNHVAFFSNDSMRILFARWRYVSSIYHVPSRLWFWFRDPEVDARAIAEAGNAAAGSEAFFADETYVAYWR